MAKGFRGLVHLYIGSGKGKTTAAVGLAVRAAGRGLRVMFCQFLKAVDSGEIPVLETIDGITVFRPSMRHKSFLWDQCEKELAETSEDIKKGWLELKDIISNGGYDMVILDEILYVIDSGYLIEHELLETVNDGCSEYVLTGRDASPGLIETADYVSCMEAVKHPFQKGIHARRGIEY